MDTVITHLMECLKRFNKKLTVENALNPRTVLTN